jgi:hypothetical protein
MHENMGYYTLPKPSDWAFWPARRRRRSTGDLLRVNLESGSGMMNVVVGGLEKQQLEDGLSGGVCLFYSLSV